MKNPLKWLLKFFKKQDHGKPYRQTVVKLLNLYKKIVNSEVIEDFTEWTEWEEDDKLLKWLRAKFPKVLEVSGLIDSDGNKTPVKQAISEAAHTMRILTPKERTGLYIKLGGMLLKKFPLYRGIDLDVAEDQVQLEYHRPQIK